MSYDPATYVEEIPVKISEKYRPPRKVTLSPLCNYQINSEVLTSEYDLTREYEMLKWIQNLKTYKEEKIKLRKQKIKKYEEEKEEERRIQLEKLEQKRKEEEEENKRRIEQNEIKEKEEIENSDVEAKSLDECDEKASNIEDTSTQSQNSDFVIDVEENSPHQAGQSTSRQRQDPVDGSPHVYNQNMSPVAVSQSGIAKCNNSQNIAPQVNVHNITYPPMLIPTQFSAQPSHHKSPTKSRCNINFADFEGDATDPFDNASLKSINDMEELAKILQNSNIKQKSDNQNFTFPQSGTYLNGGYSYNPYSYMNFTDTNLPLNNPSHFNQIPSYQAKSSSSPVTAVPLAGKSSSPFQNEKYSADKQYPQWNQFGPNNTSIALSESSQYKPFNYLAPHNVMSPNSNANVPISDTNVVNRSLNNGSFQLPNSGVTDIAVSKRQDLEDFYTRYYANTKKPLSEVRSGESTPINHQANKASLPSSNSVPDLTASEDSEVSKITANNQFETAVSPFKRPSRPYSTSGYEVYQNKTLGQNRSSTNVNRRKLPDPFTQLTEDAQTVVQNMAEMGFPRDRVARAVQKLGTEHKNLPEVLLTLQSFQESG
ncbi:hypothetical protein Avbf_15010, partial [Armadillidium vulgare]